VRDILEFIALCGGNAFGIDNDSFFLLTGWRGLEIAIPRSQGISAYFFATSRKYL
jgi:hypothetical protein